MNRLLFVVALSIVAGTVACGGGDATLSDTPWVVTADSSGDTIRVRVSGDVPANVVRNLVPEVRVGAEDGAEEETFGSISYVLPAADGGMLVYDNQAQAARLFDADGQFLRRVGAKGGGPGEHGHLNGIAKAANDDWLFWDAEGGRLNRYTPSGDFVTSFTLPVTGWYLTDGLRADTAGMLYVWSLLERDPTTGEFIKAGFIQLDSSGTVRDTLVFPSWGPEPPSLRAQSPDGGSTRVSSVPFTVGSEATLLPSGALLSGSGASYTIVVSAASAKPLRIDREMTPVPVSDTEREEHTARITQSMRALNPSWNWTGPGIPTTKPPFRDLFAGDDGRIWVQLSAEAETIPETERAPVPQRPNPPVQMTTREPYVYEVFAADGRLLARVAAPPKTRIVRARGNTVWAIQLDAMDVSYAVRMRIEPALP